jgi:hypothetical protein
VLDSASAVPEPLEHDVVLVASDDGLFTIHRATGVGTNSRHYESANPVSPASRTEAIAIGDKLAAAYNVDLWVVDGTSATLLSSYRHE